MDLKRNSLCWYCAKSYGHWKRQCSWTADKVPIKGWTATRGHAYYPAAAYKEGGVKNAAERTYGYHVTACPEFEQDVEWADFNDARQDIMKMLKCKHTSFYAGTHRRFVEYEQKTGYTLPEWLWVELRYRKDKKCVPRNKKKRGTDEQRGAQGGDKGEGKPVSESSTKHPESTPTEE